MKTPIYSVKKCYLHSANVHYSNYILPVFRTNFLNLELVKQLLGNF